MCGFGGGGKVNGCADFSTRYKAAGNAEGRRREKAAGSSAAPLPPLLPAVRAVSGFCEGVPAPVKRRPRESETKKRSVFNEKRGVLMPHKGGFSIVQRKETIYKKYDELPLMLSVMEVAAILGISRAGAYELVRSEDFPTIKIGSRIIVPKEEFIAWIKAQTTKK